MVMIEKSTIAGRNGNYFRTKMGDLGRYEGGVVISREVMVGTYCFVFQRDRYYKRWSFGHLVI